MLKALLIICSALLISCDSKNSDGKKDKKKENGREEATDLKSPDDIAAAMNYDLHYDLSKPEFTFNLDNELKEISGLSFVSNEQFACIQDEQGILYIYNVQSAGLDKRIPFGAKGDYESVAIAGDDAWILSSQGQLTHLKDYAGKKPQKKNYNTGLNPSFNFESMCYDKEGNRLLIMAKDKSEDKSKKDIYSFNPGSKTMDPGTVYSVSFSDMKKILDRNDFPGLSGKLKKALEGDDINELFRPTDLSINPVTSEIYIISSVSNLLLILDKSGKLVFLCPLEDSRFMQPEGIAFDETGNLFISNEGQNAKPNILKFSYEK
jgi:uncharacterized protein YjiK